MKLLGTRTGICRGRSSGCRAPSSSPGLRLDLDTDGIRYCGMKSGLTQAQRKQRTRARLVRRPPHLPRARLSRCEPRRIGEAAGYSKGAVCSNFAGKAELSGGSRRHCGRARSYAAVARRTRPRRGYRAVARFRLERRARAGLGAALLEFWTYQRAACHEAVSERGNGFSTDRRPDRGSLPDTASPTRFRCVRSRAGRGAAAAWW
jgi:hypothetical protein